jgi:hypothetical protein
MASQKLEEKKVVTHCSTSAPTYLRLDPSWDSFVKLDLLVPLMYPMMHMFLKWKPCFF